MITGPASGLGTWVLAGGTALGTTHAESGLPCQDSIATWVRPPGGTGRVVAEVGDGVVAVRTSGGIVGPLAPQRGEFANETTFITTGGTLPELASASFPAGEVTAFGLSSDGMRLLITAHATDGSPHVPFFEDVFGGVVSGLGSEALAHFLEAADDRTGDDKSLVIGVLLP